MKQASAGFLGLLVATVAILFGVAAWMPATWRDIEQPRAHRTESAFQQWIEATRPQPLVEPVGRQRLEDTASLAPRSIPTEAFTQSFRESSGDPLLIAANPVAVEQAVAVDSPATIERTAAIADAEVLSAPVIESVEPAAETVAQAVEPVLPTADVETAGARPEPTAPDRANVAADASASATTPVAKLDQASPAPAALQPPAEIPRERPQRESFVTDQPRPTWTVPRPYPAAVAAQLDALTAGEATRGWATRTLALLDRLTEPDAHLNGPVATLDDLADVIEQGRSLADTGLNETERGEVLRAAYALERRMLVWRQVDEVQARAHIFVTDTEAGTFTRWNLERVRARFRDSKDTEAWSRYLKLDELMRVSRTSDTAAQRELAREVLGRMESLELTDAQAAVMHQPPFSDLARELRRWCDEPINYARLLRQIEAFEADRSTSTATPVAVAIDQLRWHGTEAAEGLGDVLDTHYRNANIRVAVSGDLVNRLLPTNEQFEEPVNENIVGARVMGNARTSARLRAQLLPDHGRWNLALEVEGEVESETAATRGPATFYNLGRARYQARKRVLLDRRGVRADRAEAEADSRAELRHVETSIDWLPIVGWLARTFAVQQHREQSSLARWQTESRLRDRTQERFDEEVERQLAELQEDLDRRLLEPLRTIKLPVEPVDLQTTDEHLIGRYRLATPHQLAAYTPRPRAPEDSLLSVQVHQSLLNNTLEQLQLEGRRVNLRELIRELADLFEQREFEIPEDVPADVTIEFSPKNAVRVQVEEGRLALTLGITELKTRRQSWRYFAVRAYYVPDPTGQHAELHRDGPIQLMGRRLSTGDQIALRLIFSTVLSKNRPVSILGQQWASRPGLSDLKLTQFDITDGWIAVSLAEAPLIAEANEPCERR